MKLLYASDTMYFWLIKDGKILVEGGHIQIANFIVENDIIDFKEFMYAWEVLEQNDHEVAQFGILGGFMYTEEFKKTA